MEDILKSLFTEPIGKYKMNDFETLKYFVIMSRYIAFWKPTD